MEKLVVRLRAFLVGLRPKSFTAQPAFVRSCIENLLENAFLLSRAGSGDRYRLPTRPEHCVLSKVKKSPIHACGPYDTSCESMYTSTLLMFLDLSIRCTMNLFPPFFLLLEDPSPLLTTLSVYFFSWLCDHTAVASTSRQPSRHSTKERASCSCFFNSAPRPPAAEYSSCTDNGRVENTCSSSFVSGPCLKKPLSGSCRASIRSRTLIFSAPWSSWSMGRCVPRKMKLSEKKRSGAQHGRNS